MIAGLVAALLVPFVAPPPTTATHPGCFAWLGQIDLRTAVWDHPCVHMLPGTYNVTVPITIPAGHTLTGSGRDLTVLRAVSNTQPWNGAAGMLQGDLANNLPVHNIVVGSFTLDANNVISLGFTVTRVVASDLRITGAQCDGVTVSGPSVVLTNSLVEGNGFNCGSIGAAGIYVTYNNPNGTADNWAPVIVGNTIRNNRTAGLDVNTVDNGVFAGNTVTGNQGWTGAGLYHATGWRIEGNTIRQPASDAVSTHAACARGPAGGHSAGIWVCRDGNVGNGHHHITNNAVNGWYGILLVGYDLEAGGRRDMVPRFVELQRNDVFGSIVGCGDDFTPGVNGGPADGQNTWTFNNCQGDNTPPHYF